MKEIRIVLDTNLWISFLISKKYKKLSALIEQSSIRLIFSLHLFEEFLEVVNRPKFEKLFSKSDISRLIDLFDAYGELVEVTTDVHICRDNKDDFLLNLSIDGQADYLITGDKDLLVIENIKSTKILTYSEFLCEIE